MGRRRQAMLFLLLSVALLGAACKPRSPGPVRKARLPAAPELVWPPPPHPPRIRFLAAVASPRDLGIEPSFWRRLAGIVTGKKEEQFIRPTGVTLSGSVICVADPGAQALWILDPRAGRWRVTHSAGRQRLVSPVAVAAGPGNTLYLADSYLHRIFIYHSDGRPAGAITGAQVGNPAGIAYDGERDRLYVADSRAHVVRALTGGGTPLAVIGRRGTAPGEFNFPTHLALGRDGTLYVTDALNFRIQMFAPDGTFLGQFGEHGDSSGQFAMPKGVGVDSDGHIYVVDALFDAVQIFDRRGRYLLTFGQRGTGRGQFWLPGGLFVGADDRIYVADAYNRRIQIFQYLAGGGDA